MLLPRPTLKEEHLSPDVGHGIEAPPAAFLQRGIWTGTGERVTVPGGELPWCYYNQLREVNEKK